MVACVDARYARRETEFHFTPRYLCRPMNPTASRPEDLLLDAARTGNVPALQSLLATGLDVNTANAQGFTALTLATYGNHAEATQFLLAHGANPNVQDVAGNTALMGLAFKGYAQVARLLLQHGADPNRRNATGSTALMFATQYGQPELAQLLREAGATAA